MLLRKQAVSTYWYVDGRKTPSAEELLRPKGANGNLERLRWFASRQARNVFNEDVVTKVEVRAIIEEEIQGDWSISNAHKVDLRRCLVSPRKVSCRNTF